MESKALDKARSRLRIAAKAVADLETCTTFADFSDHWYIFLTSAKNVYTVLEQGSKNSATSRQWFGAKKTVRKGDMLLQYLYEARNDDEHGLSSSVNYRPEKHEIGVSGAGFSNSIRLDGGPFKNVTITGSGTAAVFEGLSPPPDLRVTSLDNKPVLTRHTPAAAILVDVVARGPRHYPPPTSHFGNPISDTSPIGIAKLAIVYLKELLSEASELA